ncbi:exocyst complex component 2-like [Diadema setosum]|uniref:exocyst complex component 2-like n=1 Tax=Diadema setosum TaxID=31175 RepID=UPI003B3A320D
MQSISIRRSAREPPKVTGLSPKEGPPGTKLTIRGENLGLNAKDLFNVTVCGVNVTLLAEWISPSKIICRTTNCKGPGDVVVTTKSAGAGTSTIKFRGLQFLPNALQESAIWVDESSLFERRLNSISRPSSPLQVGREDPLGLPMEHTPQMSDDEVHQMFPQGSSNLAHRNFEPALFLIESHSSTSFSDLKKGLEHLKRQSSGLKTEGPQTFIKSNLGTFMNCQDILATIHGDLCRHENIGERVPLSGGEEVTEVDDKENDDEETGVNGEGDKPEEPIATLQKIEEFLVKGNENAKKIFQSVLHRKDRADSTRNALNVLNRFKFLFHLPITIERNIKKGDYEVVINDYERARQLFSSTEVTAFKKVYDEVENRIRDLQVQLHEKLMELPTPLEDQKRYIRYLVELGAPGDPAWECIVNEQKWILKLLSDCKDEHILIDQKGGETLEPPSHAAKVRGHRRNFSGSGIQIKFTAPDSTMEARFSAPQQVMFLEELADNLLMTFPELWRLGQSYFNASVVSEAGGKGMTVDTSKETIFKTMMTKITSYFADLVRAAFLPESLEKKDEKERASLGVWIDSKHDTGAGAWLPQCVRNIRSVLSSLMNLEVPSSSLEVLQSLLADLRVHCMITLFKEATEDIKALHGRETWVLQMDEHGGITTLPTLFESLVIDTLQHLKEVISCNSQGEKKIFDNRHVERQTVDLASEMLMGFASCLEQLADLGNDDMDTQKLRLSEAAIRTPESLFQSPEDSIPSMEQCLVIVLSNCSHVSQHVIPNLMEQFKRLGYPSTHEIDNQSQEAYAELDEKIFEAYCEQKIDPLVGALEVGVYAGNYDWANCPQPVGVRAFVKDALMNAVAIHAEINAIAPAFMLRVMGRVLEAVADEMSRIMSCVVGTFSSNGAIQARLDIGMLEEAMSPYRNAGTSASFMEALSTVPQLRTEADKKLLEELQVNFRRDLHFLLTCFTTDQ